MSSGSDTPPHAPFFGGDPSVELSSNRTSLSFERTRMSADRTLMSTVRTSLSLIGFGFTIHEAFRQFAQAGGLEGGQLTGRRVGLALLALGVLMLIMGIVGHLRFSRDLTARRSVLVDHHLLRHAIQYSATPTFIAAGLLLLIGISALGAIAFRALS